MASPEGQETLSQGGSTVFDITLLNKPLADSGVATNPDGYTAPATPTSGQLSATVVIYNATTVAFETPSSLGLTAPTVGVIAYAGSAGAFTVTLTASASVNLSTSLPANKYWAISWTTTIGGVAAGGVSSHLWEVFRVVTASDALFASNLYCQVDDVRQFLGMKNAFSSTTRPTDARVLKEINNTMDEIDHYCHHSWRLRTSAVEEYNYNGFGFTYGYGPGSFGYVYQGGAGGGTAGGTFDPSDRGRLYLRHRKAQGLLILRTWNGATFDNWLTTKTEGRGSDYSFHKEEGYIMFGNSYPLRHGKSVEVQYTYGELSVPGDIARACEMLTARRLLFSDDRTVIVPEGTSNIAIRTKMQEWYDEAYILLSRHREFVTHNG